ncbi:MAG: ABC transporter substrate-binding protein [Oscillospiraceae bacterium]|nr:ABC transporter substrate-binding protein [Oscillospiraceae bacterium]
MNKLKRMIALALSLVMTMSLAACGSSKPAETPSTPDAPQTSAPAQPQTPATPSTPTETPAAPVEAKDTIVYAMTADPGNVANYMTSDDRISMSMLAYINDGLFTLMPDGSYKFTIADSFDASADGLTYTCKIKSGLKWSDGADMTVEDILFSFETYMAADSSLTVNGEAVAVNKVDDTTIEFVLPGALASFPESVADVPMLAKHIFEGKANLDMDLTAPETVVGCGPYKFAEYKSGEYLKLVKNENYAGGDVAAVENFVIQIITNDETAKAALLKGDVDIWVGTASQLDGLEAFNVIPYSEGRVAYTRINRVSPNMQDKDVRKAIFYAINRNDILTAAYSSLDYATPSYTFLPKTNGFYTEDVEQYTQDVAKAQELLAGKTVPNLKICYIGTDAAQTAQATVIQAQLAAVGINLELCGVDQAAYMASAYDNTDTTYDMYLGGYIMTIDPDGYKGMFGTGNMINYASAELDQLFEDGKAVTDSAARQEIYTKAQQLVADEALFYPFGTNLRLLVVNPNLQGVEDAALVPIITFEDISKLNFGA